MLVRPAAGAPAANPGSSCLPAIWAPPGRLCRPGYQSHGGGSRCGCSPARGCARRRRPRRCHRLRPTSAARQSSSPSLAAGQGHLARGACAASQARPSFLKPPHLSSRLCGLPRGWCGGRRQWWMLSPSGPRCQPARTPLWRTQTAVADANSFTGAGWQQTNIIGGSVLHSAPYDDFAQPAITDF